MRLCNGTGTQIKCQAGDLGEGGGKGKHKGGYAELAAAGCQQIAAGGHQGDKQQGKENKQDKVAADGVHGKRPVVMNKSGECFLVGCHCTNGNGQRFGASSNEKAA